MKSSLNNILFFDVEDTSSTSEFSSQYSHIKIYDNIVEEEEDSNLPLTLTINNFH